jgi:hypothetical protein
MRKFLELRVPARAMLGLALAIGFTLPATSALRAAPETATPPRAKAKVKAKEEGPSGKDHAIRLGLPDYYTRRAIETVKEANERQAVVPHPLAKPYPDHLTVVCEAGCTRERGAQIIYMGRKNNLEVIQETAMVPTAWSEDGPQRTHQVMTSPTIDCLAGCYDTPRRYRQPLTVRESLLAPKVFHPPPSEEAQKPAAQKPVIRKREPFSPIR